MPVSAKNVLVGAPDQRVTGAILSCENPLEIPISVDHDFGPEWQDSGYISEDGLTLTPERSTEAIKDWSAATVREILSEFGVKLAWAHLETNEQSLRNFMGDDQVTVTEATLTEGRRIAAVLKAVELPRKWWAIKLKDGKNRVLIVVPDGQVTETGEVSFVKTSAITWPITMTTYPDAQGNNVYVYLDDGQVLVPISPMVTAVGGEPDPAAAGQLVTILGFRFTDATKVTFGGVTAGDLKVINANTLMAVMPAGTAGAVDVVVTTPHGTSVPVKYTRA